MAAADVGTTTNKTLLEYTILVGNPKNMTSEEYFEHTHQRSILLGIERQLCFRGQADERLVIGRIHNVTCADLPQEHFQVPVARETCAGYSL